MHKHIQQQTRPANRETSTNGVKMFGFAGGAGIAVPTSLLSAAFLCSEAAGARANHSPPSFADVKKTSGYTYTSP
jgi:hypothetical protein